LSLPLPYTPARETAPGRPFAEEYERPPGRIVPRRSGIGPAFSVCPSPTSPTLTNPSSHPGPSRDFFLTRPYFHETVLWEAEPGFLELGPGRLFAIFPAYLAFFPLKRSHSRIGYSKARRSPPPFGRAQVPLPPRTWIGRRLVNLVVFPSSLRRLFPLSPTDYRIFLGSALFFFFDNDIPWLCG